MFLEEALEVTEPVLLDGTVARQDVGLSEQNGDLGGEDCVAGGRKRRWDAVNDEPLQYVARHLKKPAGHPVGDITEKRDKKEFRFKHYLGISLIKTIMVWLKKLSIEEYI